MAKATTSKGNCKGCSSSQQQSTNAKAQSNNNAKAQGTNARAQGQPSAKNAKNSK